MDKGRTHPVDGDEARRLVSSLFSCWYPCLVRYGWRATGSLQLAEDLVQEVFLRLYRELRAGAEIRSVRGWTFAVLRHEIGRQMRSRDLELPLEALTGTPARAADFEAIEQDELTRLFSVLSKREEEVLLLRMASLKYREIAAALGISQNSVNTLLARALRKLQKAVRRREEPSAGQEHVFRRFSKTLH